MKFETAFNCGDSGWVFNGDTVRQLTIGRITVQYTKSGGVDDGYVEPSCPVQFDNYKPQPENYEEVYMCEETGIGSGSLYTLGKHIFRTKEECEAACADAIKQRAKERERAREWQKKQAESRLIAVRLELASLERDAARGAA